MKQMVEEPPRQGEYGHNEADGISSISLLGVKVHSLDMASALDTIRGFIRSGEPHIVVTADASMIVRAQEDPAFRELVNSADLVTPDGAGLLKGSSILGMPLRAKVSGVDMVQELCRMSAEEGFSVFFLGAEPGVAELAAQKLAEKFPGMKLAGTHHGYFKPDQDAEIAQIVKASGAQVLFVAMGIPRQEWFIRNYMREMGICVGMGVGGSFDVFSGKVTRAPVWFQKHGLEWAYRLAKDPSKISKVAVLPRFAMMVLKKKFLG